MRLRSFPAGVAVVLLGFAPIPSPILAQPSSSIRFVQVSAGLDHGCGLTDRGTAYCWGADQSGQLGDGENREITRRRAVAVAMPAGVRFTRITAGTAHTCALAADGGAWCWGADLRGELGDGPPIARRDAPVPVAARAGTSFTDISAGTVFTCATASTGKAYCWGSSRWEVLGTGTSALGDRPSPAEVGLPLGVRLTSVSAGNASACAIGSNRKAYCWGSEAEEPAILGDGPGTTYGSVPVEVRLPPGVVPAEIGVGLQHACLLGTNGKAYCWGSNEFGQLGTGAGLDASASAPLEVRAPAGVSFTSLSVGSRHTCALSADGQAYCWGDRNSGGLGADPSPGLNRVPGKVGGEWRYRRVAAGHAFTCAVDTNGRIHCWGSDVSGQLGNGEDREDAWSPTRVLLPGEPEVGGD